jgi:hypothetical protein
MRGITERPMILRLHARPTAGSELGAAPGSSGQIVAAKKFCGAQVSRLARTRSTSEECLAPAPPTLRQQFYAPSQAGTLEIRATDLQGLRVHINGPYDLSFDAEQLAGDLVTVDLSPCLVTAST